MIIAVEAQYGEYCFQVDVAMAVWESEVEQTIQVVKRNKITWTPPIPNVLYPPALDTGAESGASIAAVSAIAPAVMFNNNSDDRKHNKHTAKHKKHYSNTVPQNNLQPLLSSLESTPPQTETNTTP